jgi:hypothetical protein
MAPRWTTAFTHPGDNTPRRDIVVLVAILIHPMIKDGISHQLRIINLQA